MKLSQMSQSQGEESTPRQSTAQPPPLPSASRPATVTVTVEDLLHLKRAERPAPEFWDGFEKKLKQRQLAAAIEEKRSWRHALPEMLRIAFVIPASAAAALAIGLIVWRNSEPAAATATPAMATTTVPTPAEKIAAISNDNNVIAKINLSDAPAASAASAQPAQTAATPAPGVITVALAATPGDTTNTTNDSATMMARANAAIPEFALVAFKGARASAAKTVSPSTLLAMPVQPGDLVTIKRNSPDDAEKNSDTATVAAAETPASKTDDAASDPRRERMLAYMEATVTPASATGDNPRAERARSRVASRLNDKVVTDSISRFDATGDSLSIKF